MPDALDAARTAFERGDLGVEREHARAALDAARTSGDRAALGSARAMLGEIAYDERRYAQARELLASAERSAPCVDALTHAPQAACRGSRRGSGRRAERRRASPFEQLRDDRRQDEE
jgi:hypothetical protein